MSDLPGLPAGAVEAVPVPLRILASSQNLGTLRSVHRPASRFTALQFRQGRIYLSDQGFVLAQAKGKMLLFRRGQFTLRPVGSGYLIAGADRLSMGLGKKWSGFAELERAITAGAGEIR